MQECPRGEKTAEIPQLTGDHWEYIANMDWIDPKINQFAHAVVNKRLTGDNQNHQLFLGQRHWKEIEDVTWKRTYGLSKAVGMVVRHRNFTLSSEIYRYAIDQIHHGSYSLNDHYASLEFNIIGEFVSDWETHYYWNSSEGAWYSRTPAPQTRSDGRRKFQKQEATDDEIKDNVLYHFLLKKEDGVIKPAKLNPDALELIARTKISPITLIARLREYDKKMRLVTKLKGRNVIGWEIDVTQFYNR